MGLPIGLVTSQQRGPASSFAVGAANNGVSVDSVTGKLQLGNLTGTGATGSARLTTDREIYTFARYITLRASATQFAKVRGNDFILQDDTLSASDKFSQWFPTGISWTDQTSQRQIVIDTTAGNPNFFVNDFSGTNKKSTINPGQITLIGTTAATNVADNGSLVLAGNTGALTLSTITPNSVVLSSTSGVLTLNSTTFNLAGGGSSVVGIPTSITVTDPSANTSIVSATSILVRNAAATLAVTLAPARVNILGIGVFASNALALGGGLVVGDLYRNAAGVVSCVF